MSRKKPHAGEAAADQRVDRAGSCGASGMVALPCWPVVTLYRFDGGGHQVPGRPQVLPGLLGLGSLQINAAEAAMDTFPH